MFLLNRSTWAYSILSPSVSLLCCSVVSALASSAATGIGPPIPPPSYMVDNTDNYFGAAPDHYSVKDEYPSIMGGDTHNSSDSGQLASRAATASGSSYWLANMAHGKMPYAPSGYTVWRNVMDYGAKGDGVTDDTEAINKAITDGGRCGNGCGSTSTLGAVIFFPAGIYMVSSPIIQYYYTQFIGDPTGSSRPTIKGLSNFQGIALVDTDVYIPGGNGSEWYINQNQFYRQIRNLKFDLTAMPNNNTSGDQMYVPCGIHWQVSQSTSLQNIDVVMPQGGGTTAVGIFTENGSGGFMSDLTFFGGNIGMRVGSQQFTARSITFTSCATAVSMIWDWGWTWQNIVVNSAYVAFDCTSFGGVDSQGTGSLTIIDSHFSSVPYAIALSAVSQPAITLDNLLVDGNTPSIILISGGATILEGPTSGSMTITSWAMGRRYITLDDTGESTTGDLDPAPNKPSMLLGPNGAYFTRSKPQYETLSADSFINVADYGATGDGTGDQSSALNAALSAAGGRVVFIPSGIYPCGSTINVPVGSYIVGEAWPQIMATGGTFSDPNNPAPLVRVGNAGDTGIVEISDLLFTVAGNTAGAVLVEWNVHESSQGSVAMWDSHFRVGGAVGSNLQAADCPASSSYSSSCLAASLLMHVTSGASGYFENNWLWVADHDLDTAAQTQINILAGRGLLVESKGPTWFWGGASEHSVLYQYQFINAANVFIGHMQTETPYFQPSPIALGIFPVGVYASDPIFEDCSPTNSQCLEAWALLIRNSTNIFIYGAGFYSWFQSYSQTCLGEENCQQRLMQTDYSEGIWMYSQYTKGATECVSPLGGIGPVLQSDNRNGFLTAISAWIPLALTGANIGGFNGSIDEPTPDNLLPVPGLDACGSISCGQTLTLTPACASEIAALPTSGANNNPPVTNCIETCDLFRLITGTCCGTGGSVCFGLDVPPDGVIPAPLPLPSGYVPPVTITRTGIDPSGTPTTTIFPPGVPLPIPIIIPPGPPPIPGGGPPLALPPPADTDLPDDPVGYLIETALYDTVVWLTGVPLTSVPTSTTSIPYPPWPTVTGSAGFHIVGWTNTENGITDTSLGVIGSANDNCETIVNNLAKYGAYGFLGNGDDGEGLVKDLMFPNYVNDSTAEFYLLEKGIIDDISTEGPLCGVTSPSDFRLTFFSTYATYGAGSFGFHDSSGNTGTCILNNSPNSCEDSAGRTYQMTDLMICEADGNPSYCADH